MMANIIITIITTCSFTMKYGFQKYFIPPDDAKNFLQYLLLQKVISSMYV